MTEFLAEDNICGQNLLQIVAVGNAIIAEISRVKDYIPELYRYEFNYCQLLNTKLNIWLILNFTPSKPQP